MKSVAIRDCLKLLPLEFRNIGVLSECYTVYALDLLGFGASDKPPGFAYTMEGWAQVYQCFSFYFQ